MKEEVNHKVKKLFYIINEYLARELQSIAILKLFENDCLTKDGEYDLKCYAATNQMDANFQLIINNYGNYSF